MPGRFHNDYYAMDLLSDILGRGQSSRLYNQLVKEKELFTSLSSFCMGSVDPGLVVISGRVKTGVDMMKANEEVDRLLDTLLKEGIMDHELDKVKAQAESVLEFGEVEVMNRAMNLAFAKLSGDASLVNHEGEKIRAVTRDDVMRTAQSVFREENSTTMFYKSSKS